jgi:TolA-binding protein
MKRNLLLSPVLYLTCMAAAQAQSGPAPVASPANGGQGQPVSYASVTQLNGLLSQIEAASKDTQTDLGKLRIERWKTDGSYKKQALGNVDSIQRNLQGALPEMITQLRNAPEDLPPTFKLYRNLDALYDVLRNVTEDAAAYGSKDDLQSLSNDLSAFEGTRKQLAERIENLSSSKEGELTRLRGQLKTLQAQVEAAPPKKIVVDDTEPPKKPAPKKKPAAKSTTAPGTKPAAGGTQTPPAQQQGQSKPQ